jgi:hypothetical protein
MRTLSTLLRIASVALPREHRQRWREEALAVLLAVRGVRRWRYGLDTALKAPLLAWQHQRASHPDAPAPWVAVLAGIGLLCVPVLAVGAVMAGSSLGPDAVVLCVLLSPVGLLPTIAVRSLRTVARAGAGPRRYAFATSVTLAAAAGPVVAGTAAVVTGSTFAALAGASTPGVWLACASVSALRRRTGPVNQALLGALVGTVLAVTPIALQVGVQVGAQVGAQGSTSPNWVTVGGTLLLGMVLLPTLLSWTVLAGLRTLVGRHDVIAG